MDLFDRIHCEERCMEVNFSRHIIAFQKGDYSSFDEFYFTVKQQVFYNIMSLTSNFEVAEDLLQETFLKFLESVNKLKPDGNILGFLMVTSRNLTLDYFRKNKRYQKVSFDENMDSIPDEGRREEDNALLDKIRSILKPKEFEIFTLRVMSDLSYKEIAKLLRRPMGTIQWAYNNAIKKLREEIDYEEFR